MDDYRKERDLLGAVPVPQEALYGVHTARALGNFPLSGRTAPAELIHAFGTVKLACARTNRALGAWVKDPAKADAIEQACGEVSEGLHDEQFPVDLFQGGAGTSMNLNANEVIANRALEILGEEHGAYGRVSPLDDRLDTELAQPAGDQLGVLGPEIEDQDDFVLHGLSTAANDR